MRPETNDSDEPALPFPESLCHRCAAPPRYIRTQRSVFIFCPVLKLYPRQPLRECEAFRPRDDEPRNTNA
jgi:hypothetical protein